MLIQTTIWMCFYDRRLHFIVAVYDTHALEKHYLHISFWILAGCCSLRSSSHCRYCECIPWILWPWRARLYLCWCWGRQARKYYRVDTVQEKTPFCVVNSSKCCLQEVTLFAEVTVSKTQRHSREATSLSSDEESSCLYGTRRFITVFTTTPLLYPILPYVNAARNPRITLLQYTIGRRHVAVKAGL